MHAIKAFMLVILASRVTAAPRKESQDPSVPVVTMPVKAEPRSQPEPEAANDTKQHSAALGCTLSKLAASFQLGKSNAAKSTCEGSYVFDCEASSKGTNCADHGKECCTEMGFGYCCAKK